MSMVYTVTAQSSPHYPDKQLFVPDIRTKQPFVVACDRLFDWYNRVVHYCYSVNDHLWLNELIVINLGSLYIKTVWRKRTH